MLCRQWGFLQEAAAAAKQLQQQFSLHGVVSGRHGRLLIIIANVYQKLVMASKDEAKVKPHMYKHW
jgi:hypothetical protein